MCNDVSEHNAIQRRWNLSGMVRCCDHTRTGNDHGPHDPHRKLQAVLDILCHAKRAAVFSWVPLAKTRCRSPLRRRTSPCRGQFVENDTLAFLAEWHAIQVLQLNHTLGTLKTDRWRRKFCLLHVLQRKTPCCATHSQQHRHNRNPDLACYFLLHNCCETLFRSPIPFFDWNSDSTFCRQ